MKICTPSPTRQILDWHAVTLKDKASYDDLIRSSNCQNAERAFANLYIWNELYHHQIAFFENTVLVRFEENGFYRYLPPTGTGDLRAAAQRLLESDPDLTFVSATEQEVEWLTVAFPNTFTVNETRDLADYLYDAEALATLSGKKLHAKRNHVNAFLAAHSAELHPLTAADHADCLRIAKIWNEAQNGAAADELRAIERALGAFDELSLYGAVLIADGKAVAFTVGSLVNADTLDVHFEKALPELTGAYPVINREFVRMMRERLPLLRTINREDDLGLENLRRAKLSYRPHTLIGKFTLTCRHI